MLFDLVKKYDSLEDFEKVLVDNLIRDQYNNKIAIMRYLFYRLNLCLSDARDLYLFLEKRETG